MPNVPRDTLLCARGLLVTAGPFGLIAALLRDAKSGVEVAFVLGGAGERLRSESDADAPVSLGSLFYAPLSLIYREASARRLVHVERLTSLTQLVGGKINIGECGGGTPNLVRRMLDANKVDPAPIEMLRLEPTPAVVALLDVATVWRPTPLPPGTGAAPCGTVGA